MRRVNCAALLIAGALLGAACAPAGFVETTANVLDEMSAFRIARKQNTRDAWENFIRQYPQSSKAKQARQWVQMMPDNQAASANLQAELRRAEREQAEARRLQAAREDEERKQAEAVKQQQEAAKQLLAAQQQAQFSQQNSQLLAELKKKEDELNRREAELARREEALKSGAAAQPAASADDIDVVPRGGLPQNEENFAIVIGIEQYRDIQAKADYAERDARTMLLYLRDYLGFPEQNIKFLSGAHANLSDFAKMIDIWLPLQVTPESHVFIYYSGHGAPDPNSEQAYLLPYDGDPKALEVTAYPLKRMYEKLGALQAKEIVLALDSCFSGAGGRSVIAQGTRPLMTRIQSGKIAPKSNLTVFTASSGEEVTGSYENQKHGLFTYYFLRGLRGDADADHDGWVSIQEEYSYLKKNVSLQANRDSRSQTPQLLPDLSTLGDRAGLKLAKIQP